MKTKLRTKQQGDVLLGILFVIILFTVIYLAYTSEHTSLSVQQVQKLEQKCTQAKGEAVINVNTKQEPKFVQCKLSGVLYNKF